MMAHERWSSGTSQGLVAKAYHVLATDKVVPALAAVLFLAGFAAIEVVVVVESSGPRRQQQQSQEQQQQ